MPDIGLRRVRHLVDLQLLGLHGNTVRPFLSAEECGILHFSVKNLLVERADTLAKFAT